MAVAVSQVKLFVERNPHLFLHDAEEVVKKAEAQADKGMLSSLQAKEILGTESATLLLDLVGRDQSYIRAGIEAIRY